MISKYQLPLLDRTQTKQQEILVLDVVTCNRCRIGQHLTSIRQSNPRSRHCAARMLDDTISQSGYQ